MKNKPDDRRDNVDKIQYNITKTIQNCELADEMIAKQMMKNEKTLIEKMKEEEKALDGNERRN
ncbi:small acid-soluble spore protein Tlp [Clostridium botulinum]|nr:small acid-soluble spore protein Tlp [Clostridium botulinum]